MEKVDQGRLNERFVGLEDKRPSEDSLAPYAMLSVDDYIFLQMVEETANCDTEKYR